MTRIILIVATVSLAITCIAAAIICAGAGDPFMPLMYLFGAMLNGAFAGALIGIGRE
ncbi:hypothetical protein [Oricola thermophila]|uniref:Uncharacterized protein n=1 Tax=Oricola thermophila TaxID=2742145 RepID=A0A6N1VBA8_9HYPH|nr:hypothetical protein [Oricola thermophila]QKV17833.1 hypothetical protein HTY61_04855 [Oricola thermophila]